MCVCVCHICIYKLCMCVCVCVYQALEGKGHTNAVVDLAISGDMLVSCGLDDTLRTVSLSNFAITGNNSLTYVSIRMFIFRVAVQAESLTHMYTFQEAH